MSNFEKITATPEALGEFLDSLTVATGPWDEEFHRMEIVRIGDTKVIPIDVRVIAATNRSLEDEVRMGRFRSDLFYRLNVLTLQLPTLEERRDDIPFLAKFFLAQETPPHEFTDEALEYLKSCPWPGNIRQLKNQIERTSVFVDHYLISQEDLRQISAFTVGEVKENTAIHSEKSEIEQALRKANGNRSRTAQALGISTVTLWRRMKKYHMI